MAKYLCVKDTWLSHECRLVKAGDEFEAEFPKGMKLGENLKIVTGGSKKPAVTAGTSETEPEVLA